MKVRARRKALHKLQLASSRLGQYGKDARFFGGEKWSRADRDRLAGREAGPPVFNSIKVRA